MHTKTSSSDRGTRASSSTQNANSVGGRVRNFTQNAARLLALALVAYGPWFYGSASWNSQVVCVVTSAVVLFLAVMTNLKKPPKLSVPHWCLAAVLAIAMLQTVPLPDLAWSSLSPNADFQAEIESLSAPLMEEAELDGSEGTVSIKYPRTISVFAEHTLASAAVLASALAMMMAGSLLFTSEPWKIGALLTFTVVGIANALVGLMQVVAWNDWTLLDSFNGKHSFATFVNRNSVAQYYSIAIGAAMGVLVAWNRRKNSRGTEKKYHVRYPAVNVLARLRRRLEEVLTELDLFSLILLIIICLLLVAVLAAASRGGILATAFALCISIVILLNKKSNVAPVALGIAAIGCAAVLFLSSFELDDKVSTRLETVSEEIHQLSNVRFTLWREVLSRSEFWLTGSGYGTFHLAVLQCPLLGTTAWFYHAENIYVETFVTTGILGCIALLAAVGWLIRNLLFNSVREQTAVRIATVFPIIAISAQSLTDFSVMLPAIFLPLSLLIGIFCRERIEQSSHRKKKRRNSVQDLRDRHRSSELSKDKHLQTPTRHLGHSLMTIAIACFLLGCMGFGLPILLDFGKAEALARAVGGRAALPTINLEYELARQKQLEFARAFQSLDWPSEMEESTIKALTRPEVAVAAIEFDSPTLTPVAKLLQSDPRLAELLRETCLGMLRTAERCPVDWRPNWGILRSDLGVLSQEERTKTAMRLLSTASRKPTLLRTAGTHSYWTDQRALGRLFWHASLRSRPRFDDGFYVAAEQLFTADDLDAILPENLITRVTVAKGLEAKGLNQLAEGLLDAVDRENLVKQAEKLNHWLTIEWLAARDGDIEREILALRNATRLAPMDSRYSFRLAQRLKEIGDLEGALTEIGYAVRRSPNTQSYKEFEEELRSTLRTGP